MNQAWIVDSVTYTTTQAFDLGGRLLWKQLPDGDGVGSSGTPILYDSAGRLKTVPGLAGRWARHCIGAWHAAPFDRLAGLGDKGIVASVVLIDLPTAEAPSLR